MERAIVLLSGGIDSAVSLLWSMDRGWEIYPLTFQYHLRPERERAAVEMLTNLCGCKDKLISVDLPFMMEVEDMQKLGVENPLLARAPLTYVPARNLVLYSIAAHHAEVTGARWIVGGHNGPDSDTFPDADPEFFSVLNELLGRSLLTSAELPVTIVNPLQGLSKSQVIRLGVELGVPLAETWSCSLDRKTPCGECHSCQERAGAFEGAGLEDPLLLRLSKEVA